MISPSGAGNIDLLLASFRSLEERPIRNLETQKGAIDKRISLFSDLKSKLSSLSSIATELSYSGSVSVFGMRAATSSDETVATVTATSSASVTAHTLFVSQLAKADQVVSNQYTLTGSDLSTALGAGTFTFDVTVNGTTQSVSVDIAATDDNQTVLNSIVSAVNDVTDIGISASLVKDSATTGRVVFASDSTGADFEMTLADTSGTLLSTAGLNDSVAMSGTSGGYIYASSALNAVMQIDGLSVSSNSNTVEDAVSGLTINLLKTQESGAQPVTINVTNDVEGIKGKLQSFIDAYNEVIDFIKSNTSVDSVTHLRSPLAGDFSVTNIRLQMRQALANPVTGLTAGDPTILTEFGISVDRDGKLSISDSEKLEDNIRDNLDQIEQLFNSSDGYSGRLTTLLDTMTGGEGILEKRKDVLQSQINRMNSRIDLMRKGVDKKMEFYRQQFAQLQTAFAQFSAQSSYLSTLSQVFI